MSVCCIIPARYNSKRLPGKPLLKVKNQEILLLTYNQILKKFRKDDIYVFTDSKKVVNQLKTNIKNIIFFKKSFVNGTERASYGTRFLKKNYKAALLVSCDNPYIGNSAIKETLRNYKKIQNDKDYCGSTVHCKNTGDINNKNIEKIILDNRNDVIYISRSKIPYNNKKSYFFSHHGPVCLKMKNLKDYIRMKNTNLQILEDNEWLKYIENGYKVRSSLIRKFQPEINTKLDLIRYRKKK